MQYPILCPANESVQSVLHLNRCRPRQTNATCSVVFRVLVSMCVVRTCVNVQERTIPGLNVHAAAPDVGHELRQHQIVRDRECNGRPPTTAHTGPDYL